jgi:predicted Rossmann fold flavoprotein
LPSNSPAKFDVAVIGAGAAGMMCAATAGQRGRRVVLIDHYGKVGEKIRISGGGRCNFTNIHATHRDFLSRNPDFSRSALARYTPRDFIALVDKHGIAWHEKTLGQLFCDESSKQIIQMLVDECAAGGVAWRQPCEVRNTTREATRFLLDTTAGPLAVESLVIATGGLTVPKIGATPFGYRIAEQFGLAIVPPKPALVPLSFDPELLARYGDLSGISVDAETWCLNGRFRENLLFTHRGLSGPSILQVSSYWQQGEAAEPIHIDLLPGVDVRAWFAQERRSRSTPGALLAQRLPKRFAQQWSEALGIAKPMAELSDRSLDEAARALGDWRVQPSGTLGYNKAEVTLGGVDTRGLSSKTMEVLRVPGLYFIGEVVDVTGHLGGFNFQWAWASGRAAGEAA